MISIPHKIFGTNYCDFITVIVEPYSDAIDIFYHFQFVKMDSSIIVKLCRLLLLDALSPFNETLQGVLGSGENGVQKYREQGA